MNGRRARGAVVLGAVLVLVAAAGLVAPALGQEGGEGIGGFDADARAAALKQIFRPNNNIVPTENLIDLSNPYAAAQLSQGPAGHALAATSWPGDTFANACAAFPEGFPDPQDPNFQDYPEGAPRAPIPCYSLRAESFSPPAEGQSTTDENTDVAGAVMETKAEGTDVSAKAEYTPQGAEGFSFASQSATAADKIEAKTLVSESASRVNDIILGGGAIRIGGVTSTAKATSDGNVATVAGGTTVVGASVGGVPVTISENGVSLAGQYGTGPLGPVLDPITPTLNSLGVSMRLTGPTKMVDGASGEITSGGLIVSVDNTPYLSSLPPELTGQLPVDLTGTLTLIFGQTSAKASATPGFGEALPLEDVVEDTPVDTGGADVQGETLSDTGTALPVSGQVTATETSAAQPTASRRGLPSGASVTLALVLLALLGSGLAAYGLNKLATGVFEPVASTNCPLESG